MSIAVRAAIAVVLMLGFYALALGVAGGLLWIPYAELRYAHRLHPKLALGCLLGAGAILWSVLPRPDRFEPPGPRLLPGKHPRLFQMLRELGKSIGQPLPAEVYLVPDVNAWVSERGGLMGIGSRRVMGLGLALLRVLRVSELKAVLAHEYGHYHGGDTRLGPWVYKTRAAIGRTLEHLGESFLQFPFRLYGKLFLRITNAISRHQERKADELAARACGARALAEGLKKVHGAATAFGPYYSQEVAPLLEAGKRPPFAEGFARFLAVPQVADAVRRSVEEEAKSGKADPYDTHPSLKERIQALRRLPPGKLPAEDAEAHTVLDDVPGLEKALFAHLAADAAAGPLVPIAWERVEEEVLLPQWAGTVAAQSRALAGLGVKDLPCVTAALEPFLSRLDLPADAPVELKRGFAAHVLGCALAQALVSAGFTLSAQPGESVTCVRGEVTIEPFGAVTRLVEGEATASAWEEVCDRGGIGGLPLAASAAGAAPAKRG